MRVRVPKLRTLHILRRVHDHFLHSFTPQLSQDTEFSVQPKVYRKLLQFKDTDDFCLVGLSYNDSHGARVWELSPSDRKRYRPWPERARFFVGCGIEL